MGTRKTIKRRGAGINIGQNVWIALDAMMANKLRSALTMLGVIIGVCAVVSLLSVGRGAEAAITEQIEGVGTNLITIIPGGQVTSVTATSGHNLTLADAEAIEAEVRHIVAVAPEFRLSAQVAFEDNGMDTLVIGEMPEYAVIRNLEPAIGRFISQDDVDGRERVAVLGSQAADELFGGLNPIGRTIRINNVRFEVIGVLAEQGAVGMFNPNTYIYVPLSTAYRKLASGRGVTGGEYLVSTIMIRAETQEAIDDVIAQVESILRRRHRLDPDEDDDFTVISQQELLGMATSITSTMTVFLAAIAGVSLLVGGIGIMNITLVSVTERTKEIGIRKAVGAQRWHILAQFLIETVVLSATGGLIGIALSGAILAAINSTGALSADLSPEAILIGFGFSVLVGVFFGLYPANRAASLHPIEALRYE